MDRLECEHKEVKISPQTFEDGSEHIRVDCGNCGKFIKWERSINNNDFVMPFGKYKGTKIMLVAINDPDYLHWLYWSKDCKNSMKKRIDEVLSSLT